MESLPVRSSSSVERTTCETSRNPLSLDRVDRECLVSTIMLDEFEQELCTSDLSLRKRPNAVEPFGSSASRLNDI